MDEPHCHGRQLSQEDLAVVDQVIDWEIRLRGPHIRGADLEDLKQAIWLKVCKAYRSYEPGRATLKTFMEHVVGNELASQLKVRRRRHHREGAAGEFDDGTFVGVSASDVTNWDAAIDVAATLGGCLGTHSELVQLVSDGRRVSDAARELGIPDSTARLALRRFGEQLYPDDKSGQSGRSL